MRANLDGLDYKNMHETKKNKNREALFVYDRSKMTIPDIDTWFNAAMVDLVNDKVDTITITVKRRTW